jgi:hypothetical protein
MMTGETQSRPEWAQQAARWIRVNVWLLGPRVVIAISLMILAMAVYGIHTVAQGNTDRNSLGFPMFCTVLLKLAYDYRQRGFWQAQLDERETALDRSSNAIGAYVVAMLAVFWPLSLTWFAGRGLWFPSKPHEWQAVGTFAAMLFGLVSTIAAAWMTPPYAAELLDDD